MTSNTLLKFFVGAFVVAFFAYLFGPLVVMGVTAFNSSNFPRVAPWECFTAEWFDVLRNDQRLMSGLYNSVIIGLGVVALAVPIGLAGALLLTQVSARVRPWYYTIVISPILVPGVVLGISTLIFWDRLGAMFNAEYDSLFYNGIFLTIIGQATFISAYSMLVFISRLQRFDPALEEAALDLGATHVQSFRKVMLPFLRPAIGSAAVLAFLASFENYNTTVFTAVSESTLTTVLASKVRYGINPSISALAVVIVTITLLGAVVFEIMKRREAAADKAAQATAAGNTVTRASKASFLAEPALIVTLLIFLAGLGTVYFAGTVGVAECKAEVATQKRKLAQERIEARKKLEAERRANSPGTAPKPRDKSEAKGTEGYRSIFDPGNLQDQSGTGQSGDDQPGEGNKDDAKENTGQSPGPADGEGYEGVFAPGNLQGPTGEENTGETDNKDENVAPTPPAAGEQQGYQGIFDPSNLKGQVNSPDTTKD